LKLHHGVDRTASRSPASLRLHNFMNISLIELRQHGEVLDSLIRQTVDLGYTPTVYTNTFCLESSAFRDSEAIEWRVCPPDSSHVDFIGRFKHSIKSKDHMVIITPVDDLCDLLSGCGEGGPVFHCLVHNYNTFIAPDDRRPNAAFARMVLRGGSNIVLPDARLVRSEDPRRTRCINIAYPQYPPRVFAKADVRCCIPGRVYDGRDSAGVLSALTLAAPRLRRSLNVEFLGENSSREFENSVGAARAAICPSVELRTHGNFVPQEEFDLALSDADFLILPITESIDRNGVIETRGESCVSGNINDMVRFGIPSIIPRFYPLSGCLNEIVEKYGSIRSMADLIVDWVNTRKFNQMKQEAVSCLKAYRTECLTALSEELRLEPRDGTWRSGHL
jgi:hypothetical protein